MRLQYLDVAPAEALLILTLQQWLKSRYLRRSPTQATGSTNVATDGLSTFCIAESAGPPMAANANARTAPTMVLHIRHLLPVIAPSLDRMPLRRVPRFERIWVFLSVAYDFCPGA
jgi:hypothetical protein